MKPLHLAACALNQTPLDWEGNRERIRAAIAAARDLGAEIVCLPELCIPGYGCEDAFHGAGVWELSREVLDELLPETRGLAVSFGLPVFHRGALYNCAALAVDGRLVGLVAKQHMAGDGLHYEPRWFKPWPRGQRADHDWNGQDVPIGDLVFDVAGVRIGFEICEDAWVADRNGAVLARRGVDVILNPSASHFAFGKAAVRDGFVGDGARAFGVAYVYANLMGNESGRAIYDGQTMVASPTAILARGQRFSFREACVTGATIDLEELRAGRARQATHRPDVDGGPGEVRVRGGLAFRPGRIVPPPRPAWEETPEAEVETFTHAVALALFDYARKSRSRGFVVSLSGGADSAAVACLCSLAVQLGVAELGAAAFRARLGLAGDGPSSTRDLVHELLTTLYQATRNSSETTRSAAAALADALGARHHELDVDALVGEYTGRVEEVLGRELTWEHDDLALQNVQARVRSPSAWLFANLEGKLLVSTSNRSEAAVGYATMDGDTSGGLSPLAGIDKAFLHRWLAWLQTTGGEGIEPVPALGAITALPPTAELRPASAHQTDEADLMPYPLLDQIEDAAVGRKRTPLEVYLELAPEHPDVAPQQLAVWIERFFRLWSRNQWKRERYAPAFHVDDRNLDPKTWCRFPILSGGYELELRRLREHVAGAAGR